MNLAQEVECPAAGGRCGIWDIGRPDIVCESVTGFVNIDLAIRKGAPHGKLDKPEKTSGISLQQTKVTFREGAACLCAPRQTLRSIPAGISQD
jgi:hypothetical protein